MAYKNNNNYPVRLTGSMIYNLPAGETVTTQEVIAILPPGVEEVGAVVEEVVEEVIESRSFEEVIEKVAEEVAEEVVEESKKKKRGRPKKERSEENTDS